MPTTTKNTTDTTNCTANTKKQFGLQRGSRQSHDNFCGCRGHYFEPLCVRFSDGVWRYRQNHGKCKKYDKKIERAKFGRAEYKKIPDAIRFYLKEESFDEKEFFDKLKMIDDFVSDHCLEIPTKINKKYDQLFAAL